MDSVSQTLLELLVSPSLIYVLSDRGPNHLGYGLVVDSSYRFKLLGLIRREADCHCFRWFHRSSVLPTDRGCQAPW
jgi:hypothetical protein